MGAASVEWFRWSFWDCCKASLGLISACKTFSSKPLEPVPVGRAVIIGRQYMLTTMLTGGLIVLGLFLKHWDVPRCIRVFDILIRDFFGIHLTKGSGLLTRLRDWFRCWLSDGRYDVTALETSLKEIFGDDRRLFDVDRFGVSGQKIAVTATTLSDASTYIFSNYNGIGTREKGCGKCSGG